MVRFWLAAAPLLLVGQTACYSPSPHQGLPCSPEGKCPDGQSCGADLICSQVGGDMSDGSSGSCAPTDRRAMVGPRLTADDGQEGDNLGQVMALSGDWAALGVENADAQGANSGAVYMFERSGSSWTQKAKLTPDDGAADAHFGAAVAFDGTTLLVGAPGAGDPDATGVAYVFTLDAGVWTQHDRLVADLGVAGDSFGAAVAISGDELAVGAPDAGAMTGEVYLFKHNAASWVADGNFVPGDATTRFGFSLAMNDNTLAIGTPGDDDLGPFSGSVFVVTKSGATWASDRKLTASDGSDDDSFGYSVALSGDMLAVGATLRNKTGAVYVYDGPDYADEAELTADDGAASDNFGQSVAASTDWIAVGSPSDDDLGSSSGSFYIFARSGAGSSFSQTDKLSDVGGAAFDQFGSALVVDGDTLLVGSPLHDTPTPADTGSVLTFDVACP